MRNKFNLFLSSFIILFFLSITSIHATTTWLGGSGAWGNPALWDTGVVPGAGDDVIIPSGSVKIFNGNSENALSVEIQSSARLYIYNGGTLEISGAVDKAGLHNMGRVYVVGNLFINNITQTDNIYNANGIENDKYIFTYASSQINIENVDDFGILNDGFSYFKARGNIWIFETGDCGIFNEDRFYNFGTITIEDCGESTGSSMANIDLFDNTTTGEVHISADIYNSLSNSGTINNYGSMTVEDTDVGFTNTGEITNHEGANIDADYNNVGYFNRDGGTIYNYGSMESKYALEAVYNYGTISNYKTLWLFYSASSNGGLRNFTNGIIHNYDNIYILGTGDRDVGNEGVINNYHGAKIEVNNIIDIKPSGILINDGFMVSYLDAFDHIIDGVLENNGAIDDNYGRFPVGVDNQKLIVAPVAGPMYDGVLFPDVLDVTSLTGLTLGEWKISPTGLSAGIYDETTNEFLPNSNAIGITTIYIEVEDDASGFLRNFSLEVDGGVLAIDGDDPVFFMDNESEISINKKLSDVTAFPNPTTGSIQLESEMFEANPTFIKVFNTLGQVVQEDQLSQGGFTQRLNLSSELTSGIYFMKIFQKGKEMDVQRIQLQR